jgi:hypothetical protein
MVFQFVLAPDVDHDYERYSFHFTNFYAIDTPTVTWDVYDQRGTLLGDYLGFYPTFGDGSGLSGDAPTLLDPKWTQPVRAFTIIDGLLIALSEGAPRTA